MAKNALTYLLLGAALLSSCAPDAIGPQRVPDCTASDLVAADTAARVYIINEGNFTWGNASFSIYDPLRKTISNNVFSAVNNRPLGDVAQSVLLHNNHAFLVVNNSGKVEVLHESDLTAVASIAGLASPRYMVEAANKLFISDLYANAISVCNSNTFQVSGQIAVPGWTEQLLPINGELWCVGAGNNNMYLIDPVAEQLIDSVAVGEEPNSAVLDAEGFLWVLCSGGFDEELPTLHKIDVQNRQVVLTHSFAELSQSPTALAINASGTHLFWLNTDLWTMHIHDSALPATAAIAAANRNLYNVAVHPLSNEIYLTDARSFVEEGTVYRYAETLQPVDSFQCGIIPGHIAFGAAN